MKRFRDTDLCKWLIVAIELALIAAVIWGCVSLVSSLGLADDYEEAWIICRPGDYINIRPNPNKRGEPIGRAECGYRLTLDCKKGNGYLHCVDLSLEMSEGWVFAGYVVFDEPELLNQSATVVSKGRLAVRKYVNGKRTRWLKPMATVKVYYWTDEWCVTNYGFILSDYLEMDGE